MDCRDPGEDGGRQADRHTYHLDAIVISEGAVAILAMVMVLDDVLINLVLARPRLVAQGTVVHPMVGCVHVLNNCGPIAEVFRARIALVRGLRMTKSIHVLLPSADRDEVPMAGPASPGHLEGVGD